MTYQDKCFDLVITQDVFEHVMNPAKAFAEVARILKPGGAHIFTVPLYRGRKTIVRAIQTPAGIEHLEDAVYHTNPIDDKGSLVVTEWGENLLSFIETSSGMKTGINHFHDSRLGLDAEFLEVFVSRKS
jgi:ubiquinone/menaquinone biosynthesis C-methylase UbiE